MYITLYFCVDYFCVCIRLNSNYENINNAVYVFSVQNLLDLTDDIKLSNIIRDVHLSIN